MKTLRLIGMAILMVFVAGCFITCSSGDGEDFEDRIDGSGTSKNKSQLKSLMDGLWQLYSDWEHYSYDNYYEETKYITYEKGERSAGYRWQFRDDGFYDDWSWDGYRWQNYDPKPYKVKGNQLTVFYDECTSEDGIWREEKDDHTTGTFTIKGETLTYEGEEIEKGENWSYTYSFKRVFKRVSWN